MIKRHLGRLTTLEWHRIGNPRLLFERLFFLCSLVALLTAIPVRSTSEDQNSQKKVSDESVPSPAEVSRAITLAASYLERACGPDGKFAYKVDAGSGKESSSYDIIRHAGAMYALAMVNRSHPDPEAVAALIRAATFLRQNYIGPVGQPGQQAVWSQSLSEHSDIRHSKSREHYAELGGTGLGLVVLAEVRELKPNILPLEELQALGRFALFLQRSDGSFISKYLAESGPMSNWSSLYYPGEAALGFIALYKADHSYEWLVAAGKALSFLAKSRAGLSTVPADHWALIATAQLLPYCEQDACPASSRGELVQHAIQVCNSILRDQITNPTFSDLDGAFDATGRTAPSATRLEGLQSALEFLPKESGPLRTLVETAVRRGIAFLLRAQITSGTYGGGMPRALGQAAKGASAIRIDYVQHALCAWLIYHHLFQPAEAL
jgi:hypothetical protein